MFRFLVFRAGLAIWRWNKLVYIHTVFYWLFGLSEGDFQKLMEASKNLWRTVPVRDSLPLATRGGGDSARIIGQAAFPLGRALKLARAAVPGFAIATGGGQPF